MDFTSCILSHNIHRYLGFGLKACNEKVDLQNYTENLDRSNKICRQLGQKQGRSFAFWNIRETIPKIRDLHNWGKSRNPTKLSRKSGPEFAHKLVQKAGQVGLRAASEQTTAEREHTSKKRTNWRSLPFGPKKIGGKSA